MRYRKSHAKYGRKSSRKSTSKRARGYNRKRKYVKVSRKRPSWQAATTVSPYRRFVYNDTGFPGDVVPLVPTVSHVFRGNSLYDPDATGIGVQPYGFDQVCPTFFNNYNVRSSKITVYPSCERTYALYFPPYLTCLIVPYRSDSLPYQELEDIRRMPYCRSVRFAPDSQANGVAPKVSSYVSTNAILSKDFGKDTAATGQWDGNPGLQWYWHVIIDCSNWAIQFDQEIPVRFDVKIVYYAHMLRKQELNES